MAVDDNKPRSLPVVGQSSPNYEHPLLTTMLQVPGLSVAAARIDEFLEWGLRNSLWVFPMATSCCGIELMAAAAARVDLDRMGTIVRATPRQADVMVVAGTITVKMAPRVLGLWEQMPEPKWCIAMGSCAISGDFYRNLYSVIPGIDTAIPVDVYIPGCPPNPEALMHGLLRLQEKVIARRKGTLVQTPVTRSLMDLTNPSIARVIDPARPADVSDRQIQSAMEASSFDRSDEPREGEAEPEVAPRDEETEAGDEKAITSDGAVHTQAPDVEALLREQFGVTDFPKDAAPKVPRERHVELAKKLKSLGYKIYVYSVASHYAAKTGAKAQPERFEVAYGLRSVGRDSRMATWRVELEPGQSVPTLVGVFAGADWQEREQYDLVGVRFEGHPDLRRIMMPDNWQGHPLRKDYAADTGCPPWR